MTSVKTNTINGNNTGIPAAGDPVRDAEAALADMPAEWVVNNTPPAKPIKKPGASNAALSEGSAAQGSEPPIPESDDISAEAMEQISGFAQTFTGGGSCSVDDIMAVMMEVMKFAMKDAREDQKIAQAMTTLSLIAKSATLNKQTEAIEKGMDEAKEKAEIAMNQAVVGMALGVAMGVVQAASAVVSFTGASAKASAAELADGAAGKKGFLDTAASRDLIANLLSSTNAVLNGVQQYTQGVSEHDRLMIDARRTNSSGAAKIAANELQIAQNEAEKSEQKAEDTVKTSREHVQALKDQWKKLMEQWAQMSNTMVNAYR
jgi:hypothetical protein